MERLIEKHLQQLRHVRTDFIRGIIDEVQWDARLIGIRGARGIGKTTFMLQYIKRYFGTNFNKALYVSLDNIWFTTHLLTDLADDFIKRGGTHLFLDEVHKYPNWSQELKNIYDDHPDLKIVFTGSSLLEILNARADLSRRAVVYNMQGLSYREYLAIAHRKVFSPLSLHNILQEHHALSMEITHSIKPLQYFNSYLRKGYYPFFQEVPSLYETRLEEVINMILEIELPMLRQVEVTYIPKIKQLLSIIASSAPFIPNISKLSEKIGINRNTLIQYLHYLDEIHLTKNIYKEAVGISALQKPNKIFLENTNLSYVLAEPNTGNLRETFFLNQLSYHHHITYADHGDFLVNDRYTFEIGGKNKGSKQIRTLHDAYIASDDIEYGFQQKIPLWLFGFLY